jgi:CBS domain-containing protein
MKDITIHPKATIKEAMEALDKTAEKVLLVVDENQALIGALTDGDIRRYILKSRDLTGTIEDAYKPNPVFVFQEDFDLDETKAVFLKNKIDIIPILDQNRKVVDFISGAIDHMDVSGFEALEILDVRSRLASREPLLDEPERARLEGLDRRLLQMADSMIECISEVANLAEMRRRAHVLPSHWWWYLDGITSDKRKVAEG